MPAILLATDADWIHEEVDAALAGDDIEVFRVSEGADVRPTVAEMAPALVILDLQIGNMGGFATCMDLRLDESVGRLDPVPVLLLLDREADIFLAERADAEGYLVKPLNPMKLRQIALDLLDGHRMAPTA